MTEEERDRLRELSRGWSDADRLAGSMLLVAAVAYEGGVSFLEMEKRVDTVRSLAQDFVKRGELSGLDLIAVVVYFFDLIAAAVQGEGPHDDRQ